MGDYRYNTHLRRVMLRSEILVFLHLCIKIAQSTIWWQKHLMQPIGMCIITIITDFINLAAQLIP